MLLPGRALDALVAEKVMGDTRVLPSGIITHRLTMIDDTFCFIPYSTDIARAWEVVEKLRCITRDVEICIEALPRQYRVQISINYGRDGLECFAYAATAPHAISLVALKAVGVEA